MSRRTADLSKSLKEPDPDTLGGPADEALVEGLARAIDAWRTRALPRVPVGRWGAIFANCASVNQEKSRLICGLPRRS